MLTFGTAQSERSFAEIPQWWYACLYTGGSNAADDVIAGVLPPLLADVRMGGAQRWFFIRYFDDSGPHLRLRIFGPERALNRLVRSYTDISAHLDLMIQMDRGAPIELVRGPMHPGQLRESVGISPAVYVPEIEKYGGMVGVELAEAFFEFSSELALWAVAQHQKGGSRDALAVLLLSDSVDSLATGPTAERWRQRQRVSAERFWEIHANWWTGAIHGDTSFRELTRSHANTHLENMRQRIERVAADPNVVAWRQRWFKAMDAYLNDAHDYEVGKTAQHLVFHQNHMIMNRLGYLPREEALLGMHTADWMQHNPLHTTDKNS